MARPIKKIDIEQLKQLAAINCSYEEASAVLGISPDTIQRRYAAVFKMGRETGRMSLKRKMWTTAMGGHVTMMIWLSKQMLGYADKVETETKVNPLANMTPQEKLDATKKLVAVLEKEVASGQPVTPKP